MAGAKGKKRIRRLVGLGLVFFLLLGLFLCGETILKCFYPLVYKTEILQQAKAYELDPLLIAAVIHVESKSDPKALSPKGAMGLMQIMPKTGDWIARKLKTEDFKSEDLYAPALNIRFGCWYLAYLLERFDGNLEHALIAYNAGPGNLDKWLSDPQHTDGEGGLLVPFEETRNYVKKVFHAMKRFGKLYEEELR